MANITASIITIGDELLIGQTIDTNSAWIAQRMNDFGIDVVRRIAVGDNQPDITDALDTALGKTDIIFITGGLGPTSDDITKPLLCQYFGGSLVVNENVLQHVQSIFQKRNLPVLEVNLKQAEVPDNCQVLFNNRGTAPGMLFEKDSKLVIAMPGVPHEMMGIVEDEVIPVIQQRFSSDAIIHRSVITAGLGESFVADRIKDMEAALPAHIRLASLPGFWMVKLRLTGRGADKLRLVKEVEMRQEEIANRLSDIVVALEDLPLEQIIGKKLTVMDKTIGLAESCTGGYLGHRFTQVLGSSKYFQGGIVCYQYSVKEQLLGVDRQLLDEQGAVSEEVARQMARGAMKVLDSNYGFGITGLLSAGGDDDKVPVGTVWMAVCNDSVVKTKRFNFPYDRVRNKEVAVNMALLMIWNFINDKQNE
jgi:nicotinamide-nucleotide amidase